MKIGILESTNKDYLKYVDACIELGVDYEIIPFLKSHWQEAIMNSNCDGFVARPPCDFPERKTIYDERLFFLKNVLKKCIYPSFNELFIYENKRCMSYWLEFLKLPHPKTFIATSKAEVDEIASSLKFPLAAKRNIGSSGSGVCKISNEKQLNRLKNRVFGRLIEGHTLGKFFFKKYGFLPVPVIGTEQRHYLFLQEWHNIKWEWRMIKIGNSFFGHQKLIGKNEKASGSKEKGWIRPPDELLFLLKDFCESNDFDSMALDIFETVDGQFLINEIQSLFGSRGDYQMKINGKPGRFVFDGNQFVFEEGCFNQNSSYNLRIQDFKNKLESKYYCK